MIQFVFRTKNPSGAEELRVSLLEELRRRRANIEAQMPGARTVKMSRELAANSRTYGEVIGLLDQLQIKDELNHA